MNAKNIVLAVGAFGAAGLLFMLGKRATAGAAAPEPVTGAGAWYDVTNKPAVQTQAAIEREWRQLDSVFTGQPDFYI